MVLKREREREKNYRVDFFSSLNTGCFFLITPLFFIIGFLFSFSFGGFTGLILANCIIDTLLHDSYFVVGHFHYVLSLGAVYTFFAANLHSIPNQVRLSYYLY